MEEIHKREFRKRIVKGLRIFLIISILSIIIVLIFTTSKKTGMALRNFSPLYLSLSLLATIFRYFFDITRLMWIVRGLGKRISFLTGFDFTFGANFLGAVTPFQVGGIPLQLYLLKKNKIEYGEGTAVIFTRGMLSAFVFPLIIPFLYNYRSYLSGPVISGLVKYLTFFMSGVIIFLILTLSKTKWISKLFKGRFVEGVQEFKDTYRIKFRHHFSAMVVAYILTMFSLIFYFIQAPLVLKGLGVNVSFLEASMLQVILAYVLNFVPTPGGSGFAEAGAAGIFNKICPHEILGIYVIIWRFFTFYLSVVIGGFVIIQLLTSTQKKKNIQHPGNGQD